jgi:hypothetical protein
VLKQAITFLASSKHSPTDGKQTELLTKEAPLFFQTLDTLFASLPLEIPPFVGNEEGDRQKGHQLSLAEEGWRAGVEKNSVVISGWIP